MKNYRRPRWKIRLEKELSYRDEFKDLSERDWRKVLKTARITSSNHDTVLALDWPHFCSAATEACGGPKGWCYTFQGNQALPAHNRHVAMVDVLARSFPDLFGEIVASEVNKAVDRGLLRYANLRYSGSGEVVCDYLPALRSVIKRGVHLWGFSRDLGVATELREAGAAVIISCDKTSSKEFINESVLNKFDLAYSSDGVDDIPPPEALVTFPVHRVGKVHEIVDSASVFPKVLQEILYDERSAATCQIQCNRCHKEGGY